MSKKVLNQTLVKAIGAGMLAMAAEAGAGERIRIVSEWGELTATLEDNPSTRALLKMLPLELPMRDHLRQEKTGRLRTPLPEHSRGVDFSNGDLGLWGNDAFVIYYTHGSVPSPGIVSLGRIENGAKLYDRPGPVTIRIERTEHP